MVCGFFGEIIVKIVVFEVCECLIVVIEYELEIMELMEKIIVL